MKNKYWECTCCSTMITTLVQDNASKYDCPACKVSGCENEKEFVEITKEEFCKKSDIELKETWLEQQEKIVDEKQKEYSWVDAFSGQRYSCSKEYYDKQILNWSLAYPTIDFKKHTLVPIITGTGGEQNNNAISYENISKMQKQMEIAKETTYIMGVDSFGGAYSYCLLQKNTNCSDTVLLSNTLSNQYDFEKQVAFLSKFFNANIIKEFDKPEVKKDIWAQMNINTFTPTSKDFHTEQLSNWVGRLTGEKPNRCCGRCDGSHDICVADRVCEKHKELGCEICYGPRTVE